MAKKLNTRVRINNAPVAATQELHSDHHPHLFGKTLIWNIDKDNTGDDLEMKAYAIAQQINAKKVSSGMLQEVPHGLQNQFVAYIEKYLDPKQKLVSDYAQNGAHEFGNLTFSCQANAAPVAKTLQNEIDTLKAKYATKENHGQALFNLVTDEHGKMHLMVNVHAESDKRRQDLTETRRIDLNQLLSDIEQFKKKHADIEVTMAGDMNNGDAKLPQEVAVTADNSQGKLLQEVAKHPTFRYQHAAKNSAFKKDTDKTTGAEIAVGITVDAVYSTDKKTDLHTLDAINQCDAEFKKGFDKAKKEKEQLAKTEQQQAQSDLKNHLQASPAFQSASLHQGHFQQNLDKKTQKDFPVKLVFESTSEARQFNNLVSLRDKKNLFQNEHEVFLSHEAVMKISKLNINQPKQDLATSTTVPAKKLEEVQQNSVLKIKEVQGETVSAPHVEYKSKTIRQDTRGEIDYSIQLTFASKKEARAFSDAMGYKNKTLLYQDDNKIYISKEAEASFLKKMCLENTAVFKERLGQIKPESSKPLVVEESAEAEKLSGMQMK